MREKVVSLVCVVAIAVLAACGGAASGPKEVAEDFWNAAVEGDLDEAKRYATRETADSIQLSSDGDDGEVTIGETSIEGDRATVATTLVGTEEGVSSTIELQTVLVQEDGQWKVDFTQTMMSMFGGAMGEMMEELGQTMQEGMEEMAEQMEQGMEQMAQEMNQQPSSAN